MSLRLKITVTFVVLFSAAFAIVGLWVVRFTAERAESRLVSQLARSVEGTSQTIDPDAFADLVANVRAVPDPENDYGLGYPDSDRYRSVARSLHDASLIADAGTYSWFRDETTGQLLSAASSGYFEAEQFGWPFRLPLADVTVPDGYALMAQGLERTVSAPAFTDPWGTWISAFAPIRNGDGEVVGAVGQDYSLAYVDQVTGEAIRGVLPVLVLSYLVLIALVVFVSNRIVRPVKRLTTASRRIADGEYDLDLSTLMRARLRDEIVDLATAFTLMAGKVAEREQSLRREVTRLKVEIDHSKRAEAVREIVESDAFSSIAARAAQMRERMRAGATDA